MLQALRGAPRTSAPRYTREGNPRARKALPLTETPFVHSPFGVRTWDDLRDRLMAYVRYRFHRTPRVELEDAVSASIVDLYDYWTGLPSSLSETDTGRNWAFALHRGKWTVVKFLHAGFHVHDTEALVLDPILAAPGEAGGVHPSAEDEVLRRQDMLALIEGVNRLSDAQRAGWYDAFMRGETLREAAEKEGISHTQVHRRRERGLDGLRGEVT